MSFNSLDTEYPVINEYVADITFGQSLIHFDQEKTMVPAASILSARVVGKPSLIS